MFLFIISENLQGNTRTHKTCEAEETLPTFLAALQTVSQTCSTFPASVDENRAFEGQILTFVAKQIRKAFGFP